ncbi:MAG TPA: hypothetical protein VMT77_06720 [Gemmatimonadales bacterium]|nr:hypothetical protein [Gemmatimonadales bacterium]
MSARRLATTAAPFLVLILGFALGAVIFRGRTVSVTFQAGGRSYLGGDGRAHRLPATLTVPDAERVRLRVVNRDVRFHALGVLSVPPGDSVVVRPDVCAPPPREPVLVMLVQ